MALGKPVKTMRPTSTELAEIGIVPDWPAPARVRCVSTTRLRGQLPGMSRGVYARFNLGDHVGDDPAAVAANRAWLAEKIGGEPCWLQQVHGRRVVDAAALRNEKDGQGAAAADAAFTRQRGVICAVMTADCLPVLLCDAVGSVVAAVHAGWRGLLGGVLEAAVEAMNAPGDALLAWLGPAIGPHAFEVGAEVRAAFVAADAAADAAFRPVAGKSERDAGRAVRNLANAAMFASPDEASAASGAQHSGETLDRLDVSPGSKYLADIYSLARQRLMRLGVRRIYGGGLCTVSDAERFFSYRRDGLTGRMATLIWLA